MYHTNEQIIDQLTQIAKAQRNYVNTIELIQQNLDNNTHDFFRIIGVMLARENLPPVNLENFIINTGNSSKSKLKEHEEFMKLNKFERRRADGRYQFAQTINGVRQYVYGKTIAELHKKKQELLDSIVPTNKKPKEKYTLFSVLDKWYEMDVVTRIRLGKKREKGKISKGYAKSIRHDIASIKTTYNNTPLATLKAIELEEKSRTITKGNKRERIDNTIGMALTWAYKKELVKRNIAEHFKRHKHDREQGQPFTRIEQERILEYAKKHSNFYFHFMTYFYTGCRPGELKEIRHCDFNFENNSIFVDGTKTKTSSRTVPIFKPLLQFKTRIDKNSTDKVFTCKAEKTRAELTSILDTLGINRVKFSLKSTRHSFCTRCRENGVDEKVISKWMGHANLQMTAHYTHILSEFEQSQAQKFDHSFDHK